MRKDASHIRQIKVVSNTHWDREFRRSLEKTRRRLVTMMDTTLDILERDPAYHSFTLDGHSILALDYLVARPEARERVERLVRAGRLVLGPWYTLVEQFSVGQEALVRNFLRGRRTVEALGGRVGTVAYTPASWGQTGQLPQVLRGFGIDKAMFYRGVSHHECDAEFVWDAPDGSRVLASRFAVYARYNWYYQVHRAVTVDRTFAKDYPWGERDDGLLRHSDAAASPDAGYEALSPSPEYDPSRIAAAIDAMVAAEGPHFTTEVFLAMHGHDVSVAHPAESRILADARAAVAGRYSIEHTDLESYWAELERHLDVDALPILRGERRAYLKEGKWTYLFPSTISARTFLKQREFEAERRVVDEAEPLACLASALGAPRGPAWLDRAWSYLLSNHTHDANGGCAPDVVCEDMEYRYRKANDLADIAAEDAMAFVASNLAPGRQEAGDLTLVVFNPLPIERDAVVLVDLELPRAMTARAAGLAHENDGAVAQQAVSSEASACFVDSIWDVPTILDSTRLRFYARLSRLPGLGYRAYDVRPEAHERREPGTMLTGLRRMENELLAVDVNGNGTVDVTHKPTGRVYRQLNALVDQGETGNAWRHGAPRADRRYTSHGVAARISVVESGPLVSAFAAEYELPVPAETTPAERSRTLVGLPVRVEYRLRAGAEELDVRVALDNRAKDHWLRAAFPTALAASASAADSHFDVVERAIALPDSTGWVERALGTHPLRTFVSLSDGAACAGLFTRGLFEYEVHDDADRTLLLTLLRGCRIRLAVSEEKQTELPDPGVQCPGEQVYEYALAFGAGDWDAASFSARAALWATPPRLVAATRGHGTLPRQSSLVRNETPAIPVDCVKPAEDGDGIVVRVHNPSDAPRRSRLRLGVPPASVVRVRMDESAEGEVAVDGDAIVLDVPAKGIVSLRLRFAGR